MSGADKTCPDCAETIKAAARVCRFCGYRFDADDRSVDNIAVASASPSASKGFFARTFALDTGSASVDPRDSESYWKASSTTGGTGKKVAIAIFVIAIVGTLIAFGLPKRHPDSAASDAAASLDDLEEQAPGSADENSAVTLCDMRVKNALLSESSYDPEFHWSYSVTGNVAEVMRSYEATNAYGAKLSSAYDCQYDIAAGRIVFLQTIGPTGNTTLIDDRPTANAIRH